MTVLSVIVGGQYGSEAKGHATQQIVKRAIADSGAHWNSDQIYPRVLNVRVGGPNAGHSAVDASGKKWALRQVPVGAVLRNRGVQLYIGPGSEVDLFVLGHEVNALRSAGLLEHGGLWVSPEATLLKSSDIKAEFDDRLQERIGSTAKGIGRARMARLFREPGRRLGDVEEVVDYLGAIGVGIEEIETPTMYQHVVIEGTQGFGLGLHAGEYPYTTSGDCRAVDFVAQAGFSPWAFRSTRVFVCVRPYAIRVAGQSGPLMGETTWGALGLPEERTTVTQKVRRVADSPIVSLVNQALDANGRPASVLVPTMLDQIDPSIAGAVTIPELRESKLVGEYLQMLQDETHAPLALVTTSDRTAVWL